MSLVVEMVASDLELCLSLPGERAGGEASQAADQAQAQAQAQARGGRRHDKKLTRGLRTASMDLRSAPAPGASGSGCRLRGRRAPASQNLKAGRLHHHTFFSPVRYPSPSPPPIKIFQSEYTYTASSTPAYLYSIITCVRCQRRLGSEETARRMCGRKTLEQQL